MARRRRAARPLRKFDRTGSASLPAVAVDRPPRLARNPRAPALIRFTALCGDIIPQRRDLGASEGGIAPPSASLAHHGASTERPVLRVSGLTKSFSGTVVLSDLDMVIRPGEVHALVGENGSGKSTVIKVLAGYHRPDPGGEVEIDGQQMPFESAQESQSARLPASTVPRLNLIS